jgi:hypothetical protein
MLPYQRTAALVVSEHTGSVPAAAARPPAEDRRTSVNAAYSKVMSDFRVVPGQSILAPF